MELQLFEDLQLGGTWKTRRRTLVESDLTAFSGISGDFNPLHVDSQYARGTHFGGQVMHAAFIAAVAMGLGSMDAPIPATVGLLGMTWKYQKPLKPGDTIHCIWRLARKRPVDDPRWGAAVWEVEVIDQDGVVAATGELTRLVARRGAPAADVAASRRPRRRRRSSGRSSPTPLEIGDAPLEASLVIDAPAPSHLTPEPTADTAPPTAARRRRRRRPTGSNGHTATVGEGELKATALPAQPVVTAAPVAASPPAPVSPPSFGSGGALTPGPAEAAQGGLLGRVFRRPRK